MKTQQTSLEAFQVIGISTRALNADELKGVGNISALWGRFFSENIAAQISGKVDEWALAVYHNYESNKDGFYTLTLGYKVKPGTPVPAGMELLNIPAQKYQQATTNKGAMPQIVIEAWQSLWTQENEGSLQDRRYTFDFEVYNHCATDPECTVDIYLALK